MILQRERNQRTQRKTLEAREKPTTIVLLTWVPRSRINTGLYPVDCHLPKQLSGERLSSERLSSERQGGNTTRHPCFPNVNKDFYRSWFLHLFIRSFLCRLVYVFICLWILVHDWASTVYMLQNVLYTLFTRSHTSTWQS